MLVKTVLNAQCLKWVHYQCASLTGKEPELQPGNNDPWYCPKCSENGLNEINTDERLENCVDTQINGTVNSQNKSAARISDICKRNLSAVGRGKG